MIIALAQAGDQVRSFTEARKFAAEVSAEVYQEQNAGYWLKYYNGVEEADVQGLTVHLGGSAVFNLADMAKQLWVSADKADRYGRKLCTFGNLMVRMYPAIMPSYIPYEKAVDKSLPANGDLESPGIDAGEGHRDQICQPDHGAGLFTVLPHRIRDGIGGYPACLLPDAG